MSVVVHLTSHMARLTPNRLLALVVIGVVVAIAGCSGSEPAPGNPALSAQPIDVESLVYPVAREVVPCPFTSEVSGQVISAASDFRPTQTKSSNTHCVWQGSRIADSLSIRLDPIDEVSPTDHSDRLFHVGRDIVIEPQSGPGTDAVLLQDPAFAEPFAYRYVFTLVDVVVDIEMDVRGLTADDFRAVAEDVVANLAAAPQIAPWEAADPVYSSSFCSIWATSELEAVFDTVIQDDGVEGFFGCGWVLGPGSRLGVGIIPDSDLSLVTPSVSDGVEPLDLGEQSAIQRFGSEASGFCEYSLRTAVADGYVALINLSAVRDQSCDPIIELAENLVARAS